MALTPLEIRNRTFKKGLRGINTDEVYEFLEEVAADVERLLHERSQLQQEVSSLKEKLAEYTGREDNIQKTLMLAQKSSEEAILNARKEADLIVEEARNQARRIEEEFADVKAAKKQFLMEFEAVVETFRRQVKEMRGETEDLDPEDELEPEDDEPPSD